MKPPGDDEETGLPGFRTWGRVYTVVALVLVAWVVVLAALSWKFA